ncbi:unnamed protein product [Ranitomeya imitator]|uniref:Cadherin domain-containing protein n=1 Tax=Ranitomeya imitator TaxID=111125 RepID=A0ABN9M0K0_9NEOB|nr:unnamed protein product [Ranitomeya imitator]
MVVDDEEKANILNTFFSTVFTVENEMLGEIPRNNENPILRVTNLTQEEVRNRLNKIKIDKSPGPDGIHPRVLRELTTGSVPQDWRIANVVPIFKKGSKSEPGNYRPVSSNLIVCEHGKSGLAADILNVSRESRNYRNGVSWPKTRPLHSKQDGKTDTPGHVLPGVHLRTGSSLFLRFPDIFVVSAAPDEDVGVLHPWHQLFKAISGMQRSKRAWVIPTISVSENLKSIPSQVVQIKSDKQYQSSVIYSIKGPGVDEEPKGIFTINKTTGIVYLNAVLDREKIDRFKLRAFALDSDGAPLEDPTDLEIVVLDQNDNRPVFSQALFKGYVLENAIPGTLVMRVIASDADDANTDNAQLKYAIVHQDSPEMFSIHQDTGEIRTVQVGLDRELVASYNLTVQVADMMGDGLSSTASAVISIGDLNDNAPLFTQEEFVVDVPEESSGLDVGRVSVTDRDLRGSPNWMVKYSIISGDPQGAFSIRTDTQTNEGILSLVKAAESEKGLDMLVEGEISVKDDPRQRACGTGESAGCNMYDFDKGCLLSSTVAQWKGLVLCSMGVQGSNPTMDDICKEFVCSPRAQIVGHQFLKDIHKHRTGAAYPIDTGNTTAPPLYVFRAWEADNLSTGRTYKLLADFVHGWIRTLDSHAAEHQSFPLGYRAAQKINFSKVIDITTSTNGRSRKN